MYARCMLYVTLMVQTIQKISCIFREIFKTFQKIHVNILGTRFNSSGTPLFNNNLLHDKQYVDKVKQHIQLVRDQYERSLDDCIFRHSSCGNSWHYYFRLASLPLRD